LTSHLTACNLRSVLTFFISFGSQMNWTEISINSKWCAAATSIELARYYIFCLLWTHSNHASNLSTPNPNSLRTAFGHLSTTTPRGPGIKRFFFVNQRPAAVNLLGKLICQKDLFASFQATIDTSEPHHPPLTHAHWFLEFNPWSSDCPLRFHLA